jgi:tyrosine-protein phosphatase YwqE
MNNFLNTIANRETDAANLFIKNSRMILQNDTVELARELTDLRVQLQEAQEAISELKGETPNKKWSLFSSVSGFLKAIMNRETNATNLFIKNSRMILHNDTIELARELTGLRVQLQEAQEAISELKGETPNKKWSLFSFLN